MRLKFTFFALANLMLGLPTKAQESSTSAPGLESRATAPETPRADELKLRNALKAQVFMPNYSTALNGVDLRQELSGLPRYTNNWGLSLGYESPKIKDFGWNAFLGRASLSSGSNSLAVYRLQVNGTYGFRDDALVFLGLNSSKLGEVKGENSSHQLLGQLDRALGFQLGAQWELHKHFGVFGGFSHMRQRGPSDAGVLESSQSGLELGLTTRF